MGTRTSDHQAGTRRLGLAAGVTGVFMVVEAVGGYVAGSLALVADAGHMFTDAAALSMAFVAAVLARRPADPRRSYGYRRLQVLAALVNSLALLVLVAWLVSEAVDRLREPRSVDAGLMLGIALAGAAINIGVAWMLHDHHDQDLNVAAAYAHVLSDLGGSAAAALGAIIILTTGWTYADPLLSLLIAALIARLAVGLLRRSTHILLEGTPEGVDVPDISAGIRATVPAVVDVHHVHTWSLGSDDVLLTLHARLLPGADRDAALAAIKCLLRDRFGIRHSTLQLECGDCVDEG